MLIWPKLAWQKGGMAWSGEEDRQKWIGMMLTCHQWDVETTEHQDQHFQHFSTKYMNSDQNPTFLQKKLQPRHKRVTEKGCIELYCACRHTNRVGQHRLLPCALARNLSYLREGEHGPCLLADTQRIKLIFKNMSCYCLNLELKAVRVWLCCR